MVKEIDNSNNESSDVWSQEELFTRVRKRKERVYILLESFLHTVPEMYENLNNAIQSKDLKAVHHYAHTFKGSSANVAGKALCRISAEIEERAYNDALDNLEELWLKFDSEYHCLLNVIMQYLENRDDS